MADPFADWYTRSVIPVKPASYDEAGAPVPEVMLSSVLGQLRRSNQLVRASDGTEVVSSATFACDINAAGRFRPGYRVKIPAAFPANAPVMLPEELEVISVSINDADPVLAGATVYLGQG